MPRFKLLIDRVQDGLLVVTNGSAEDIPIGTELTSLWAAKTRYVGSDFESQPYGEVESQSLTIQSVRIFSDKQINEVPRGWSAAIRVIGSGMDAVQKRLSVRDDFAKGKSAADWSIQLFLGGD